MRPAIRFSMGTGEIRVEWATLITSVATLSQSRFRDGGST